MFYVLTYNYTREKRLKSRRGKAEDIGRGTRKGAEEQSIRRFARPLPE